jgi:hypothetical protein
MHIWNSLKKEFSKLFVSGKSDEIQEKSGTPCKRNLKYAQPTFALLTEMMMMMMSKGRKYISELRSPIGQLPISQVI